MHTELTKAVKLSKTTIFTEPHICMYVCMYVNIRYKQPKTMQVGLSSSC